MWAWLLRPICSPVYFVPPTKRMGTDDVLPYCGPGHNRYVRVALSCHSRFQYLWYKAGLPIRRQFPGYTFVRCFHTPPSRLAGEAIHDALQANTLARGVTVCSWLGQDVPDGWGNKRSMHKHQQVRLAPMRSRPLCSPARALIPFGSFFSSSISLSSALISSCSSTLSSLHLSILPHTTARQYDRVTGI